MGNASTTVRKFPVWCLAMLLAAGVVAVLGGSTALAAGKGIVEVPGGVVTEGLTVDQHFDRQIELSGRLLDELPRGVKLPQVKIVLTPEEVAAIDEADKSSSPLKIGLVKAMTPAIEVFGLDGGAADRPRQGTSGLALPVRDGGYAWAVAVSAEGAGAIRLHLENMALPRGAELYVYSRSGEAYGPFTGTGPDRTGEFWLPTVFGKEAILQLRIAGPVAEASLREVSLKVAEVGIITERMVGGLAPVIEAAFCGNPTCIVDASCYSAANSIRDAYAKMEWIAGAFIYTCTAGALNDTGSVGSAPYYALTANHCLSKANTAKNVAFYWRFRTSSCNGSCPSNSGWPYKTTGSSVAATNRRGDFTLLKLNSAPPAGTTLLGFTNAAVANSNGVALHRVSNPNFGPQVYNEQTVSTSAPTCSGWPRGERIYSRDTLGGTDGGSSGSPVVNTSDLVVGQLSGGCGTNVNDPCDAVNNATVDGALAYYWATVQPIINP